jgi:hypothetical protein
MVDGSRASTDRTPGWPALASVVAATLLLAGCNANQGVNASVPTSSQVFAGHYVQDNPYNPISYAQNNTGIGGGR